MTNPSLLRAGHPDLTIQETTLGWEFFSGAELRGFVTGPENDDTVTSIGAADLCVFL